MIGHRRPPHRSLGIGRRGRWSSDWRRLRLWRFTLCVASFAPFEDRDEVASPGPATPSSRSTIPPEKAVELLSKISLFSALQPSYLRRIANLGIEEDYPLSALIFKEGAPGDKMYLILSGAVRISRQVPGMGEEALAVLRAGTHFGEMALIDDFPRSADARFHHCVSPRACELSGAALR